MNLLTLGSLKASELPALLNLCPDDQRFIRRVNRAIEWLLTCGSFWGTTRRIHICIDGGCIVLPGIVATLEGVRACHHPVRVENEWYRMLPGFNPESHDTDDMWFEYVDNVPSFRQLCAPRILRVFPSSSRDVGRKIKFLGWDKNKTWVRTVQGGIMQDGEIVILDLPFNDTLNEFTSITAVVKDETDQTVRVFSKPAVNDILTPFGIYEYWETIPTYQRFRIHGRRDRLEQPGCCPKNVIEAEVKLAYVPVKHDDDILAIGNRPGLELAVMGVKALDDGDTAKADVLLYGNGINQRIGAVPLLNNEIRTNSNDRFSSSVRVNGPCGFNTLMRGFV